MGEKEMKQYFHKNFQLPHFCVAFLRSQKKFLFIWITQASHPPSSTLSIWAVKFMREWRKKAILIFVKQNWHTSSCDYTVEWVMAVVIVSRVMRKASCKIHTWLSWITFNEFYHPTDLLTFQVFKSKSLLFHLSSPPSCLLVSLPSSSPKWERRDQSGV